MPQKQVKKKKEILSLNWTFHTLSSWYNPSFKKRKCWHWICWPRSEDLLNMRRKVKFLCLGTQETAAQGMTETAWVCLSPLPRWQNTANTSKEFVCCSYSRHTSYFGLVRGSLKTLFVIDLGGKEERICWKLKCFIDNLLYLLCNDLRRTC